MIPRPGRHGGDGPAVAAALGLDPATALDLSVSLNPFAPDVPAIAARHLGSLRRYPDDRDVRRVLADALGIETGRLLVTNGGSEAIALVAAELGGRVRSEPEFALHPRGSDGPCWRSDPHNPTGRLALPDERADVWDEAFFALATGRWSARRHAVTVGSLTKLYACPGLRIGYIVDDDVDRFARRQPHWSVNSLALAVLPELIERTDLAAWSTETAGARHELARVLAAHDIAVEPSDAPWLLARAPGLRERLAPHGVIVRDCTSFGLPDHVRIGVTDDAGLARLGRALDRAFERGPTTTPATRSTP